MRDRSLPTQSVFPFSLARSRRARLCCLALVVSVSSQVTAPDRTFAHGTVPPSLKGAKPPAVDGLTSGRGRIIRNRRLAVALGKALFWDIQVGSDGVACATCHHHAGADGRATNQISPGRLPESRPTAATFETTGSGQPGGSNLTLARGDFPLHRLADPTDLASAVLFTTDDVVGSGGAFGGTYQGSSPDDPYDDCARGVDAVFHVGGVGTRSVTSRNAPTVINAALHQRLFWDGRANNRFNGSSPYGDRDAAAGVWTWDRGVLAFGRLALDNSSLASQAVAPPLDPTEMSCASRSFADIGRKLLGRRPLQFQTVHPDDSVLGRHRLRSGHGLAPTYQKLVQRAFRRRYWSARPEDVAGAFGAPLVGGAAYTQAEANFAMFFGLAVQLYESQLISDDARFDSARDSLGVPTALNEQERRGLTAFVDFHCANCHSSATLAGPGSTDSPPLTDVQRKPIRSSSGDLVLGLTDAAFVNTAVTPQDHDPGIGTTDPFGSPLPFAVQFRDLLSGSTQIAFDRMRVQACAMTSPFGVSTFGQPPFASEELVPDPAGNEGCSSALFAQVPSQSVAAAETALPSHGRLVDGTVGAFKIPSLRNIELTGPYMHNGGMATLEEVVDFYDRGANFTSQGKDAEFLFSASMTPETKADLVAFLKALTDERVRWEKAPFDHPSLPLPVGHTGDGTVVVPSSEAGFEGLAQTEVVELPAVGAQGRNVGLGPLLPWVDRLAP
jgi:cytochrome c peroxidase